MHSWPGNPCSSGQFEGATNDSELVGWAEDSAGSETQVPSSATSTPSQDLLQVKPTELGPLKSLSTSLILTESNSSDLSYHSLSGMPSSPSPLTAKAKPLHSQHSCSVSLTFLTWMQVQIQPELIPLILLPFEMFVCLLVLEWLGGYSKQFLLPEQPKSASCCSSFSATARPRVIFLDFIYYYSSCSLKQSSNMCLSILFFLCGCQCISRPAKKNVIYSETMATKCKIW